MPRTRRPARRRTRAASAAPRTVDVVTQLRVAVRHPSAALIGALIGGGVPWFARSLAHGELLDAWAAGRRELAALVLVVVLGCAVFSVLTVYKFGYAAFGDSRKAVGLVCALEGVMLVSQGSNSALALGLLVAINAVANGCVIALAREATLRRQDADRRGAATRAQRRARTPEVPEAAPVAAQKQTPARDPKRSTPIVVVRTPRRPRQAALDDGRITDAEFTMFS